MIQFLNQNSGAATAILTFVYVITTILLAFYALKQAKFAQRSLEAFVEAEHNRQRPYLIFDILCEELVGYAVIRNLGSSPALNIKISVTPRLKWKDADHGLDFVENGILFLSPGREVKEPFSAGEEFFEGYQPFVFNGTVSYSDSKGKNYTEPFNIDISYTQRMTSIGKAVLADEAKKIADALRTIVSPNFKPLVRTISQQEYLATREAEEKDRQTRFYEALKARSSPHSPQSAKHTSPDQPNHESGS